MPATASTWRSADEPIPVKKQGKYNLTRWAVTGRDDLGVNTDCWRAYERLRDDPAADDDSWRELCYLWSSDFRTHITDKRWAAYREMARLVRTPGGGRALDARAAPRSNQAEISLRSDR